MPGSSFAFFAFHPPNIFSFKVIFLIPTHQSFHFLSRTASGKWEKENNLVNRDYHVNICAPIWMKNSRFQILEQREQKNSRLEGANVPGLFIPNFTPDTLQLACPKMMKYSKWFLFSFVLQWRFSWLSWKGSLGKVGCHSRPQSPISTGLVSAWLFSQCSTSTQYPKRSVTGLCILSHRRRTFQEKVGIICCHRQLPSGSDTGKNCLTFWWERTWVATPGMSSLGVLCWWRRDFLTL